MSGLSKRKQRVIDAIERAKNEGGVPQRHWCDKFGWAGRALSTLKASGHMSDKRLSMLEGALIDEGWLDGASVVHMRPTPQEAPRFTSDEDGLREIAKKFSDLANYLVDEDLDAATRIRSFEMKLRAALSAYEAVRRPE